MSLNIKRNFHLVIDEGFLELPNLKNLTFLEIILLRRIETQCHLLKNNSQPIAAFGWFIVYSPNTSIFDWTTCLQGSLDVKIDNFWNLTKMYNFQVYCHLHALRVIKDEISDTGFYSVDFLNLFCWPTANLIYIFTSIIAVLALILNFLVIATTLRSENLLGSVAHVLVANIACGDLLIALYTIVLTITRQSITFDTFFMIQEKFCKVAGVFNLVGLFISPFMTFMVTLERYFVIVYCMQPNIRITLKHAYIVIVVAWTFSISLAICLLNLRTLSHAEDDVCIPIGNNDGNAVTYVGIFLLFLYFISIALYCHIYFNVKKTTEKTEQQRSDNSIAKKIVQINITNVLFWITPIIAIYFTTLSQIAFDQKRIIWDCFGMTCLVINSSINPVLFSFRNDMFRSQLPKRFRIRNRVDVNGIEKKIWARTGNPVKELRKYTDKEIYNE